MDKIGTLLTLKIKKKRVSQFYELCKIYSDAWNSADGNKKVDPKRFMRDCAKNRRAYELAAQDLIELSIMFDLKNPQDRAKTLFGRLKNRKKQL